MPRPARRRGPYVGLAVLLILVLAAELVARATLDAPTPLRGRRFVLAGSGRELPTFPLERRPAHASPGARMSAPGARVLLLHDASAVPEDETPPGYRREDGWLVLEVEINAAGMRGPAPGEQGTGDLRVACVGDSITFGDGVPFEATFVAELAERRPDLELLDYGVPGHDADAVADVVVHRALPDGAAAVLWTVVLNDPPVGDDAERRANRVEAVEAYTAYLAPPSGLARWSRLAAWVQRMLRARRMDRAVRSAVRSDFDPARGGWSSFLAELDRMDEAARAAGARLLVAVFPVLVDLERYPFEEIHRRILAACAERGVPATDLLPAFAGRKGPDLWIHPLDQHPSAEGHAIAAEALVEFLDEELPPPRER